MRQSLSDKLLINDNRATGIPCQAVNKHQVPGAGRCSSTKLKLMFTVHAPMPGLVLVLGVLLVLFL